MYDWIKELYSCYPSNPPDPLILFVWKPVNQNWVAFSLKLSLSSCINCVYDPSAPLCTPILSHNPFPQLAYLWFSFNKCSPERLASQFKHSFLPWSFKCQNRILNNELKASPNLFPNFSNRLFVLTLSRVN